MLKFLLLSALLGVTLGFPTNTSLHDASSRIIGGEETTISRNPWQMALLYHGEHFCGAVVFHSKWGLTAAHCLDSVLVEYLSVRVGSTTKSFGGQVIDVLNMYEHPLFNRTTMDYDFGLLELAVSIAVQTAAPAALADIYHDIHVGDTATITGWGIINENGDTPEILHTVQVAVVGYGNCARAHPNIKLTNRMFCTGDIVNGGRDACTGDGGGPVVFGGRIVGIVSWGRDCARPEYPAVHAKVSNALEWIYETSGI